LSELEGTLKALTDRIAPSGHEREVGEYIKKRAGIKCQSVTIDTLGNVICQLNTRSAGPRVAVFAHMDEIGLVVRKIEKNGFLRVVRMGGIEEKALAGRGVIVLTESGEKIRGVIGIKSHHLAKPEERYSVTRVEDIYIDIGTESYEDAVERGVRVGCPVVFARTFFRQGNKVFANALDNRGGCSVLLEVLEELDPGELHSEVFFIGSVQEEFSLRGVLPAIRSVNPDVLICLDIAPACDTPDLEGYSEVRAGLGPTMSLYTFHGRGTLAGLIPSHSLVRFVTQVAETEGIPLQRNVFYGGLTDISFAQLEFQGIPAIDLGFPVRYTHSPIEACDLGDLEFLKSLVLSLLYRIDERVLKKLKG
jgi:putative aminopeptidase FrvX